MDIKQEQKYSFKSDTGKWKLLAAVLNEVLDTLERRLFEMEYFNTEEVDPEFEERLQKAALTNLGCESALAKLDNKIKVSGGSASVSTFSKKNVVVTNGLLVDSSFCDQPEDERKGRWK